MTRFFPLLLAALVLAGCGQKGPLYMPNDEKAAEQYDPQNAYEQQDEPSQTSEQQTGSAEDDGSTQDNTVQDSTARNRDDNATPAPAGAQQ